mmetsp:Transcript_9616/g.13463  ORF Transcript_9616/g.13463 Transcript_9616/m.13463 type:complete len:103 (+) Transcript_9616:82-390(+)
MPRDDRDMPRDDRDKPRPDSVKAALCRAEALRDAYGGLRDEAIGAIGTKDPVGAAETIHGINNVREDHDRALAECERKHGRNAGRSEPREERGGDRGSCCVM